MAQMLYPMDMKLAKEQSDKLCRMLDKMGHKYQCSVETVKDTQMYRIITGIKENGNVFHINGLVIPYIRTVELQCVLPVKVTDKHYVGSIATAVCIANQNRSMGSLDFDIESGILSYSVSNCYEGCTITQDILEEMYEVLTAFSTIYAPKFAQILSGELPIKQFLSDEYKRVQSV